MPFSLFEVWGLSAPTLRDTRLLFSWKYISCNLESSLWCQENNMCFGDLKNWIDFQLCVLGKSFKFYEPKFSHLQNGNKLSYLYI